MDTKFLQGVKNAIRTCMNVRSGDRVCILTDHETESIGLALEAEAQSVGAETVCMVLENFGSRPLVQLPQGLGQQLTAFSPTVTFYAAKTQKNELGFRMGLVDLSLHKLKARHAHMPDITDKIMREGMSANYDDVYKLTRNAVEIARKVKSMRVTSKEGTDLLIHFDETLKWEPCDGRYHEPGEWGNLPEGEVFTCPAGVEGVFAAQVLGDHFSRKYGILSQPLMIDIADSHIRSIKSGSKKIGQELINHLDSAENGRRVGEFAIGTNVAIKTLCGNMLQDEKIPGVHIAFGDPIGFISGATWSSKVHVDVVNPYCSIEADGQMIMKDGHITI